MKLQPNPVYFLIVDDLEENLISLEALLRRENLTILKARSGHEALELLLQYEVALALLDIQMPMMDGFELAELMRGTERTRRVPIIFLTAGNADLQRRFRGYETGAVDFLNKPIETDILRSKAEVFFELNLQQQQLAYQRDKLEQSAQALKEADSRKDEFLATLAHELRNPLAPIRNGLQILRTFPKPEISIQIKNMMDRQLTHLVRLIDDLLDVSRISQGKIYLRKELISVQSALQSALEASQPFIDAGQHNLTLDIPEKTIWVEADLTRLAQMVSNLLNNAAKYTPEKGNIILAVRTVADKIFISVTDNGFGIKADMLSQVFELFAQVDRNIEYTQGGLGIGLALVKNLVEMHGGTVKAESEGIDKGSTFTIELTASENEIRIDKPAEDQTKNITKDLRILVVDDNVDSAQTTVWMLELMGHQASMAYDGPEALATARQSQPDVILLDIGLPGMSGYEVCRELRKDPLFKDTLLVAQTGWGQDRDRQEAKEAGFNHHLTKPINFDMISSLFADIKI